MGEVELDGSAATRLEIDEEQPVLCTEDVARVRLTVKQLLGVTMDPDLVWGAPEDPAEELPVGVGERRAAFAARHELLRLGNSIGEMRRRDIELPHPRMQPLERIRIVAG